MLQLPTIEECLQRARDAADLLADPNPPLLALVTGMQWVHQQQWAKALPHLEHAVAALPEHANPDIVFHLVMARLFILPLDQALARPFPASHQADWCYRFFASSAKSWKTPSKKNSTPHTSSVCRRSPPCKRDCARWRTATAKRESHGLRHFLAAVKVITTTPTSVTTPACALNWHSHTACTAATSTAPLR